MVDAEVKAVDEDARDPESLIMSASAGNGGRNSIHVTTALIDEFNGMVLLLHLLAPGEKQS
jgi:hypothetical protein